MIDFLFFCALIILANIATHHAICVIKKWGKGSRYERKLRRDITRLVKQNRLQADELMHHVQRVNRLLNLNNISKQDEQD